MPRGNVHECLRLILCDKSADYAGSILVAWIKQYTRIKEIEKLRHNMLFVTKISYERLLGVSIKNVE